MTMEKEEGVTLGRVFKVAFHRWKLLLIITLVVGVAGTLAIVFGLNKYRGNYSIAFGYSTPDLAEEKYADGSTFYYKQLITYENLNSVKESDEKYSGIDIESLTSNGDISISKESTSNNNTATNIYTIKIGYKYCSNYQLAKDFLMDVANTPLKKDRTIVESSGFNSSLKMYDTANTFEQQVSYLANQATDLKNSYELILKGNNISRDIQSEIQTYVAQLNILVPEDFIKELNTIIDKNGFVKDYDVQEIKNLASQKDALNEEKALNTNKINALNDEITVLQAQGASISVLSEEIVSLTLRNADIDYTIAGIDKRLANKGKDPSTIEGYSDFVENLAFYRSELEKSVTSYKSILNIFYIENASVAYDDSNIIKLNGTINTAIAIIISAVVGVVIGGVVNLIVDRKKLYE